MKCFFSYPQLNQKSLPEGTEIKIPGVGSTPIAISTQLPAAVVQLSQKGKKKICSVSVSLLRYAISFWY